MQIKKICVDNRKDKCPRACSGSLAKDTSIPIFQHVLPALVLIFEVSAGQTTFGIWKQNSEVGGSIL